MREEGFMKLYTYTVCIWLQFLHSPQHLVSRWNISDICYNWVHETYLQDKWIRIYGTLCTCSVKVFCKLLFHFILNNALFVAVLHGGMVKNTDKLYFLWPILFFSYRCYRNDGVCGPLRLYALHGKGLDRQWQKTFLM